MSPGSKTSVSRGERAALTSRRSRLRQRALMIQSVREFFLTGDYLEVETPALIPAPAPEEHIDAVMSGQLYLHTSPELCMKRLLSAGYSRIFQICKCHRAGERGGLHLPEFTILEWYRAGIDYTALMAECEALLTFLAQRLTLGETIRFRGSRIAVAAPWERITVHDAFERYGTMSMERALSENAFDRVMVEDIEPRLGLSTPTFLIDYPASLAALARLKPDDPRYAERFELYVGGLELANAFSELVDAREQRLRFEDARTRRQASGKRPYPMPEPFLRALEHMPEAAGIALGIDRLAMVLSDTTVIDDVVAFTPEEL